MAATKTLCSAQKCPPGGITKYDSQAAANSGIVVATPCSPFRIAGLNTGASIIYLMLFDAATVPGNGAVPLMVPLPIAVGAFNSFDFANRQGSGWLFGRNVTTGLCWAGSTTSQTLTVDTTNSTWCMIDYATGGA